MLSISIQIAQEILRGKLTKTVKVSFVWRHNIQISCLLRILLNYLQFQLSVWGRDTSASIMVHMLACLIERDTVEK